MKLSFVKPLAVFLTLFALTFSSIGITPVYAAATLTVTNVNDSGTGSLRQAITDAAPSDTITFNAGLSGQTIHLKDDLTLSKNITIDGSSLAAQITISGDEDNNGTGDWRVFYIDPGVTVNVDSLTIVKGAGHSFGGGGINNHGILIVNNSNFLSNSATGNGGACIINWGGTVTITNSHFSNNSGSYGCIVNYTGGTMDITNTTFSSNIATDSSSGGGITNFATLSVTNSSFSSNSAGSSGGAIYNSNGTTTVTNTEFIGNSANLGGGIYSIAVLNVINSTFLNNTATLSGGGIVNKAMLMSTNTTFVGNIAGTLGGAIYTSDTLTVANNTFYNNSATNKGGGIYNSVTAMTLLNSTFSNNSAPLGGGVYTDGVLNYSNIIIANSTLGGDCIFGTGSVGTNKSNLIEDGSCSASLSGDPKLAALASNGGPTQTMALQTGSSAIDAGDDATCSASPVNSLDQRGIARPQGTHCDIGAYEGSVAATGVTFADVPITHPQYKYIQALYDAGLTAGCSTSPLKFCPDTILDRAQSAVFMLRGAKGSTYTPPPAPWTTFLVDSWIGFEWAQAWAEGMYKEGLTQGCQTSPLKFCPANQLPRVEASIFGLKMKYGVNYTPPPATGTLFADFPPTDPSYWGIAWAEKAYVDGLLPACGTLSGKPMFCPGELVNRGWGAYLIVKAKGIPTP